jgi:hypothetical protein
VASLLGSEAPAIHISAMVLMGALVISVLMILIELTLPAMSEDFRRAAELILRGTLSARFWVGTVLFGTIVPLLLLIEAMRSGGTGAAAEIVAALLALAGLWIFEGIFIKAGQAVPLS